MVAQRWPWLALSGRVERVREGSDRRGFELEELFPQWWGAVQAQEGPHMSG